MTATPNRCEKTIKEVLGRIMSGARAAIAAGFPAAAVIEALRRAADQLEGK